MKGKRERARTWLLWAGQGEKRGRIKGWLGGEKIKKEGSEGRKEIFSITGQQEGF